MKSHHSERLLSLACNRNIGRDRPISMLFSAAAMTILGPECSYYDVA